MADLKTTIAQTENLKNKVKLAKDRINETVVRGGITSKSLIDIPDNIKSMINQYNKVATVEYTNRILVSTSGFGETRIPLNLDFTPKKIFVGITQSFSRVNNYCVCDGLKHISKDFVAQMPYVKAYIQSFSKNEVILKMEGDTSLYVNNVQIIAIG